MILFRLALRTDHTHEHSGYQCASAGKSQSRNGRKKIRVIAVTASAFQEGKKRVLDTGADGYIRKPFREPELFESIGSCLGIQYVYEQAAEEI